MQKAASIPAIGMQQAPSIPDRIADALRRDIMTAELEADEPIKQGHLAARFGVSQAPVREALNQLISEHLVVHYQNRGVRVAPLMGAEFEEAARLRITLETDLVKAAAARFTDDDKALAAAALKNIGEAENVGDLMAAHDAFHDAIYAAAALPITHEIVRGLRARCSRYLGFMWKRLANVALSHDEHRQLLEFVSSGNAQAAGAFMKPHIEGSTAAVLACLEEESGC